MQFLSFLSLLNPYVRLFHCCYCTKASLFKVISISHPGKRGGLSLLPPSCGRIFYSDCPPLVYFLPLASLSSWISSLIIFCWLLLWLLFKLVTECLRHGHWASFLCTLLSLHYYGFPSPRLMALNAFRVLRAPKALSPLKFSLIH